MSIPRPGERTGDPQQAPAVVDLEHVLYNGLSEAMEDLTAAAGVIFLPDAAGKRLHAAMIGGTPPATFIMLDKMDAGEGYASSTAWRTGRVAVIGEPAAPGVRVLGLDRLRIPFPYSVVAVSIGGDHRYGALALIRIPERDGAMTGGLYARLLEAGEQLAHHLAPLAESGIPIRASHRPPVFPRLDFSHASRRGVATWGLPDVPGSSGLTMMYAVHQLYPALGHAMTMDEVAQAAQERIMRPLGAQALLLTVVADGRLWVVGHAGATSRAVRQIHGSSAEGGSPPADVLRGARDPRFYASLDDLHAEYPEPTPFDAQAQGWAFLPLHSGTGAHSSVGTCCLGWDAPHQPEPEEQGLMTMMASLLGTALDRARRVETEHALAEHLQTQLLPARLPDLPEIVTTGRYLPAPAAAGVGGDWYDVISLPGGRIALIAGDVEGHALQAAGVMGQLRSAVRAYAAESYGPAALLTRAGALLAGETDLLATCAVVTIDPADGTARYALAGHPPPLICTPDGRIAPVDTVPGPPLGMPASVNGGGAYHELEIALAPGTLLALYTDGLCPARTDDPVADACALLAEASRDATHDLEALADRITSLAPRPPERRDDAILLLARLHALSGDPHRRTAQMPPIERHDLQGVRTVRDFVRDVLTRWQMPALIDDVALAATELVTNGLLHADTCVRFCLREYPDFIRVEVRDIDPSPPVPSSLSVTEEESDHAESGRGLVIVEFVARAWGTSPAGRGKIVWCELSTAEAEPPSTALNSSATATSSGSSPSNSPSGAVASNTSPLAD